jgi:hypothetical protein
MKGRFPPDLSLAVFGPIVVVAIALGLGSFIFRIAGQFGTAAAYAVGGLAVAVSVAVLLMRIGRR